MLRNTKCLFTHCLITLLGIWLIFSNYNVLLAQQNEINFNEITTKDGLLDDVAISIVQDAKGYMWFGTRAGLDRYDGVKVQNFTFDPALPDGLSGNNVVGLHIDKNEILWIGTINGLCRFDEKLDRPVKVVIKINEQLINPNIQVITSSSNGLIWLASLNDGMISYDPKLNKSVQYIHSQNETNCILSNRIFSLFCGSDDLLWIGTDNGLNKFDQKKQLFESVKLDEGKSIVINSSSIRSIKAGLNGNLWFGTSGFGLIRFNPISKQIKQYKHSNDNNSLSSNYINTIMLDNSKIWIGSGQGVDVLNRLDPETGIVEKFDVANLNRNVFGSSTNDIFIDKTGIIWIAKSLSGIKYFDPTSKNYTQFLIDNSGDNKLVNRPYGIFPISDTKLWASTFDGLVLFDLNNGVQKQFRDQKDLMLLNGNSISVQNELWIPSRVKGIVKFNIKTEKFSYIQNNSKNEQILGSNYINILYKDQNDIVWSGSRDGGLDRIDPKTKNIKRFNHIPGNSASLPNNSVYAISEENEEKLWVGTNGGLALLNKQNDSFEKFNYKPNDSLSLSSDQVSYILKSKKGDLWIGTYGGGLNKFNYDTKIFQRYTSHKNNLPNNTVYSLVEDDNGFLWVSTAKGIAQFSPATETYDYLIELPDNYKVNKFPNGNIAFSGPRGILVFDPNQIKLNSFPPIVSLIKFNINSEEYSKAKNDSLKYILTKTGSIELNYFQNDINLEFTVAHYSNSKKNELIVFLEGNDNNWRSLGSARSINYTNLDPGKYILKAKGASAFGVWTDEPITFTIIIHPPWWKTWWAYIAYILLGLGFLYTVRNIELKRQRKNTDIKESKLRAETAEFQAKAAEAQSRVIQAENDRKSAELEEARQLQLSMLPKELPKVDNLEIAVYMKTATEVGGDYYDFSISDDGTVNVGVGDATGHGMQAGTIVTLLKGLFTSEVSKKELLTFLRETSNTIKGIELGRLMMAFSLLKIKGNQLQFSSAGMPPMYIYRKESKIVEEINMQGMPLGAIKNFEYKLYQTELKGGDCVLLMSDGYPELSNLKNEQIGYQRVKTQFAGIAEKNPDEIIKYFKNSGALWVNDNDPDDDVTFVVIKVK